MTARSRIAAAWLLFAVALLSIPPRRAVAQQVAFASYGTERGLLNTGISCLRQDRTGFLLVCTDNGLFRFDGQSFLRYGAANGLPERGMSHDLQIVPDGTMFLVDAGTLYAASDRAIPRFRPIPGPERIDDDGTTRSAVIDNDMLLFAAGTLWIASGDGEGSVQARRFLSDALVERQPALRTVTGMAVGGDTLWLGCANGRLCRLECPRAPDAAAGRRCSAIRLYGPQDGVPSQDWVAMIVDRAGTLWARSADHLLSLRRDDARPTIESIPGGVGRYAGRIHRLSIAETPDGRIVTQGPSGLMTRAHGRWFQIDRNHGLTDGEIAPILSDRQGSLWLGVRGQGLFRAVGLGEWENWTTSDGLLDNVCWQLARQRSGPLWVATDRGVDAIASSARELMMVPPLDGPTFALATTRGGRIWSANLAGRLRRFSPQTGTIDVALPTDVVEMMTIGRAGDLLLAERDGLRRMAEPDAVSPSGPVLVPGTHGRIRMFAEDADGFVWLTVDGSLMKVDPTGRQAPVEEMRKLDREFRAMLFVSPDDLWLGSDKGGLEHLVLSHGKPVRLAPIDYPPLEASQIISFATDRRGWVWVGSDHGLDVWDGRDWRRLGAEDGLLSNDLNEGSILADPDGSMWFGTGHGLSHLLDVSDVFSTEKLHPVISRVLLNGAPLNGTSIPWSQARLTVSFSDLDYRFGDTVRFRYRLEGVDRDWVDTKDTTVRYPTLPAGHLVFSVQAIEPAHRRSSDPVSFFLDVRPPWWATIWFRILAAITTLAAVTAVWRLRIRLLLAQRRQLEALVAIRTAEIAEAHAALKAQASRDGLTGLLNRTAITAMLEQLLADPDSRERLAVAVADLDHFKSINDRHGHFGGDAVLRQVSARAMAALRPGEFVGRYGGEEFVLLLSGPDPALPRLEQIRRAMVDGSVSMDQQEIAVSCSFGLTRCRGGDNGETLLRRADRLLYRAKDAGRDRIVSD